MRVDIFDNCYVQLVEHWGSDASIIEAARMSTAKGFQGWGPTRCPGPNCMPVEMPGDVNYCEHRPACNNGLIAGDEKLLRYLYEHKHMTPFEMAGVVIEVQAPIFVFREWHRHRTQSYNELSARYTELPNLFYLPSLSRIRNAKQSTTNRQSSDPGFGDMESEIVQKLIYDAYTRARITYDELLKMGVAREIARVVIPVAQISRMRASANLRNWLQFLTLRMDSAAQYEIRHYAAAVGAVLSKLFPYTWDLFAEGKNL